MSKIKIRNNLAKAAGEDEARGESGGGKAKAVSPEKVMGTQPGAIKKVKIKSGVGSQTLLKVKMHKSEMGVKATTGSSCPHCGAEIAVGQPGTYKCNKCKGVMKVGWSFEKVANPLDYEPVAEDGTGEKPTDEIVAAQTDDDSGEKPTPEIEAAREEDEGASPVPAEIEAG